MKTDTSFFKGSLGLPSMSAVTVIATFVLGAFLGVFIAYESYFLLAIVGSAIISCLVIFNPQRLLIMGLIFSLVIVGIIESFGNIPKGNWLGSVILSALFFSTLTSKLVVTPKTTNTESNMTVIIIGWSVHCATIVFSSVINLVPAAQAVVGLRNYVPYMALFVVMAMGRIDSKTFTMCFKLLIAVGCIQGLFCVIEKILVAPRIISVYEDYEMMLGTFGGSFYTGGYTGEMAAYTCMNLVLCFVLAQERQIKSWVLWLAGLSSLVSIGLAETKIVFVVLPVMMAVVIYRYPGQLSFKLIRGLSYIAIGLSIIISIYSVRFWGGGDSEDVSHAFFYTFDPDFMVTPTQRGRVASIFYWVQQIFASGSFLNGLIGFGVGASTSGAAGAGSSIAGIGSAVKLFGLGLDASALTKLLWEVGLIGTSGLLAIIIGAYRLAGKHVRNEDIPELYRCFLVALRAWLITFVIMLPYQQSILGGTAVQFLFWFTVGAIVNITKWNLEKKQ